MTQPLRLIATPKPNATLPPHDLDAEAAVLSALLAGDSYHRIAEIISCEDFYSAENQHIFECIVELADELEPIDVVTVARKLRNAGKLEAVGGPRYLGQIVDATPAVSHITSHAKILLELSAKRAVMSTCHAIAAEGYGDTGGAKEWLRSVERRITESTRKLEQYEHVTAKQSCDVAYAKILAATQRGGSITGISTGIGSLDRHTAGLQASELTLLSAPTGGGKSALAGNLAASAAMSGHGVAIFSLEMTHDQLTTRMACASGHVNAGRVRHGNVSHHEMSQLVGAMELLSASPIRIDDRRHITAPEIASRSKRIKDELEAEGKRLELVIVDYVQLIDGRADVERGSNREREMSQVAKRLAELAVELEVSVLALVQLNAEGEVRESKAIVQHAHNWWDLRRETSDGETQSATLTVRKQRSGPAPVEASFWFQPSFMLFSDGSNGQDD